MLTMFGELCLLAAYAGGWVAMTMGLFRFVSRPQHWFLRIVTWPPLLVGIAVLALLWPFSLAFDMVYERVYTWWEKD